MRQFCSVFQQILNLFSRTEFEQLAKKHGAERHARGFRSWTQFVAMMFCHLGRAQSLREICDGLKSATGKLSHLGISAPSRATLAYANEHRPWELYQAVFFALLRRCEQIAPKKKLRIKAKLYSLDATTIDLCLKLFDWAKFRRAKGAVKIHLLLDHDGHLPCFAIITDGKTHDIRPARALDLPDGAVLAVDRAYLDYHWLRQLGERGVTYVTRLKSSTKYRVVRTRPLPANSGAIVSDEDILLVQAAHYKFEPLPARRVVMIDPTSGKRLEFLTNNLTWAASTIAAIYKERWKVEQFFRALKQNLRVKTFVGTSANAVKVQLWTALIAILVLKYLQFMTRRGWSLSNLVAMFRFHLFSYRQLTALLEQPFAHPEDFEAAHQLAFA